MLLLLYIALLFLTGLSIWMYIRLQRTRKESLVNDRIRELMLTNTDAFILLIDDDFNVLQTNYYTKTGGTPRGEVLKVGNLLSCRNGEDAGTCGTHELCATCPIRTKIKESFLHHTSFSKLEAPVELYTSDKRDSSVHLEVSITGNRLPIDTGDGMLLTIHDITAQKQNEQALIEARHRAEESDRMKSLFLANTSHEFRTPLNAIVGFSDLLTSDVPIEDKREYVQIIRANSDILVQLVNDILDLSKIEAGTLEYVYSDVDLNAIMEEMEGVFRNREETSSVRIVFERRYPHYIVRADRKRLTQVISNFLSNAVKFTPEGSISFGYEVRETDYYVYVKDTGIGIPEDKQQTVFDRFIKIGSHKQGIGIGLAICKSIVESVGGEIGCQSEVGKGSTFWFTIPIDSGR